MKQKTALVLGGGGFIGGHLAKRLKEEGFWVRVVDIKEKHEFWDHSNICHDYISGDLRDPQIVKNVFRIERDPQNNNIIYNYSYYKQPFTVVDAFDEVYQLAADMGGAGYIFTGDNDANVMHNSALVNLNIVHEATRTKVKRIFYSSSACMYPEHNQLDPDNPNCDESSAYPANPDSEYGWE
jgi:nucleoside-diphosphate-sugar epimerase